MSCELCVCVLLCLCSNFFFWRSRRLVHSTYMCGVIVVVIVVVVVVVVVILDHYYYHYIKSI